MYEKFLTNKAIVFDKQIFILFASYFAIRFFSFVLAPHQIIQSLLIFVLLMAFASVYYKNQEWAWYILLGELLLGGAGHFFEFFGLSVRTLIFITFIFLWIVQTATNEAEELLHFPRKIKVILSLLGFFVLTSVVIGLKNLHGLKSVIQNFIPYSYFILVLPAYHLFQKKTIQEYLVRLLFTYIICTSIFSTFTFYLFSSGISYQQSPYYKWFRDVVMGKITDMGSGFFRIVTPEHLLLVPIILLLASLLMRKEKHHILWWLVLVFANLTFVLEFSRIYFLALVFGLIVLKYKHSLFQWLRVSFFTIISSLILFICISLFASAGYNSGLNLLGLRIGSIASPITETSGLTRMTLLSPILEMIKENPFFGSGLGSKITFIDPIKNTKIITSQFDWGFFELWAELGIFGLLSMLALIDYVLHTLIKKIRSVSDYQEFYVGLFAGVVAMLIMNITAPVLFHTLGVVYLVFTLTITVKNHSLLEHITSLLYRTFRRLRV